MTSKKLYFVIFALLVVILSNNIFSQSYGRLHSKEEANTLYGQVLESVEIQKTELLSMLKKTSSTIMFKIVNGKLIILGDNRNLLSSAKSLVKDSDTYYRFSEKKVIDLLRAGRSNSVVVEQRKEKLTITNGLVTLQDSIICPPFCE